MLASLILSGAGQFLAGARRRGIIWFGIVCALPLFLLGIYTSPLVPAKAAIPLLGVNMMYGSRCCKTHTVQFVDCVGGVGLF